MIVVLHYSKTLSNSWRLEYIIILFLTLILLVLNNEVFLNLFNQYYIPTEVNMQTQNICAATDVNIALL